MANIQKQFLEFHDGIKLGKFEENQELRDKRDIITNKIKKGLKKYFEDREQQVPSFEFIDQGSYATDTGIKPKDGDYDIDEGVIIGLNKEDYNDNPTHFKEVIRDIMMNHTKKTPEIKKPCVTITYSKDDEPQYHVDLPVYLNSCNDDYLYLSWGKEFAKKENKTWQIADPQGLNAYINDAFSGDERRQFKRVVRYLKKWKDEKFASETSEGTPPSIGLTIIAADKFISKKETNNTTGREEYNDLKSLKELVDEIIATFEYRYCYDEEKYLYTIDYNLPVENRANVFSKMTNIKMNSFHEKLTKFRDALQYAMDESDPHKACKELAMFLGDKFPIPESVDNRYKTVGVSSAPSSNFA